MTVLKDYARMSSSRSEDVLVDERVTGFQRQLSVIFTLLSLLVVVGIYVIKKV